MRLFGTMDTKESTSLVSVEIALAVLLDVTEEATAESLKPVFLMNHARTKEVFIK